MSFAIADLHSSVCTVSIFLPCRYPLGIAVCVAIKHLVTAAGAKRYLDSSISTSSAGVTNASTDDVSIHVRYLGLSLICSSMRSVSR